MNKKNQSQGNIVTLDGAQYYKIENSNQLSPFFINIVSNSDLWIFLSSNGGMTAGRKNASLSLFPYETDDKIHLQLATGPKTIVKANGCDWEPFEKSHVKKYRILQNLYKSTFGTSIIFEEINEDLGLQFQYRWETSEKFGLVRTSHIRNQNNFSMEIQVLDGVQNVMPYGVNQLLQDTSSCLVDAYKANELDQQTNMGIYSLTTLINDTPNPIEILKANVAWLISEGDSKILLSSAQIPAFCDGEPITTEEESYGCKGAFLTVQDIHLPENGSKSWSIVLDVGYTQSRICGLQQFIQEKNFNIVFEDIQNSKEDLKKIIAKSDGCQKTGDDISTNHHYLNVLYNVMRGGIFLEGYTFNDKEFVDFLMVRQPKALENTAMMEKIKQCKTIQELKQCTASESNFYRLALEFLPLSFSRRHGDPSRPWNKFNIHVENELGEKIYNYEGNWRDIFQNWEALSISYPSYLDQMIAKFVNASTIDGFNPYRINKAGIDWERPEKDNPFSGLGYWGDHQIIYLLKLLQKLNDYEPEKLQQLLTIEAFTYANVPYEILPYAQLLKDSKNTIFFNAEKDQQIHALVKQFGTDGKLVMKDGDVYHVNLIEKLLVPVLSKLSNFVIGGGIWMNTQRPEWNDANNAIVGIGLSMVTVYHLYQALHFYELLFASAPEKVRMTKEVATWFNQTYEGLERYQEKKDTSAKALLDDLGNCFGGYRQKVYKDGFSTKEEVSMEKVRLFLRLAIEYLVDTIQKNKGTVYSSYNLLREHATVEHMRPMLEGQSAIVGSGYLKPEQITTLLEQMEQSPLYSNELKSYYLYPKQKTKKFMLKNIIQNLALLPDGKVLIQDCLGNLRFHANLVTQEDLCQALRQSDYTEEEQQSLIDAYEAVFQKSKFTGRSEVMYKYEGIGCIYWHQNAKLLLSVQEALVEAYFSSNDENDAVKLKQLYEKLSGGMGYRKTPEEWGGFPLDPYSHSSYNGKAQQPGMTGQVKEMILLRQRELGVIVKNGCISFHPFFIRAQEFSTVPSEWVVTTMEGQEISLALDANTIGFTICQTPIVYQKRELSGIEILWKDQTKVNLESLSLSREMSKKIFERTGEIQQVTVFMAF